MGSSDEGGEEGLLWEVPPSPHGRAHAAHAPPLQEVAQPQDPQGQPNGKVRANPVLIPQGESSNANLKEALGRLIVYGIYINDPMAILSPMIWITVPLLKAQGKGTKYETEIKEWTKDRDQAIRGWNVKTGTWKESKITAENTIAKIMEVAITEKLIVIKASMWDISGLVAPGGGAGEEGVPAGAEPRSLS